MDRKSYPILEFDEARKAIIEPGEIVTPKDVPEHCVLCFFQEVITEFAAQGLITQIDQRRSEIGTHPVYSVPVNGSRVGLIQPGVGAPLCAGILEELIAVGFRKFIACGGAGVLDRSIPVGHVIIPTAAIRDEGTSYHYLPPSREAAADPAANAAIEATLKAHNVPYTMGKTWTTDAIFRETPEKVALRREEGCITVEMETAAFFAVAQFRGVTFGQILYGGDDVSGQDWDHRGWQDRTTVREKLFWLAAEACLRL